MSAAPSTARVLGSQHHPDAVYDEHDLRTDSAFALMASVRRRYVVRRLASPWWAVSPTLTRVVRWVAPSAGGVSLSQLARELAAYEYGYDDPDAVTSQERKRVYVGLYQTHLPKLDDAGAVDFEPSRGEVAPTPQTDVLARFARRGGEAAQAIAAGGEVAADGE